MVKQFLEDIGSTECFERPDFHFTETLATNCALPPSGC
jgi:hypothetical protein